MGLPTGLLVPGASARVSLKIKTTRWMSRRLGQAVGVWGLGQAPGGRPLPVPGARDLFPSSPSRAWIESGWEAGVGFGSTFARGMHKAIAGSSLPRTTPLDGRSIFCSFAGGSGAASASRSKSRSWPELSSPSPLCPAAPRTASRGFANNSWADIYIYICIYMYYILHI